MDSVIAPRKLIETALPLDAINEACVREKSIRHGHPSTLHLWWARRPLAAARAILFSQLVNDPGWNLQPDSSAKDKELATKKRKALFKLITELVQWENTTNESVLEKAREEIRKSWRETCELNKDHPRAAELFNPDKLPAFHDPFAGGGAIPLEAQRLGLESHASDLNPVAVLINKAMIEIPPKFAGRAPVGPVSTAESGKLERKDWSGAQGLAEDVRRYGAWMRDEAFKRIGYLYPLVDLKTGLPVKHGEAKPGQETATVIAWLWARTVKSPDPRFSHVDVPLASTFMLSTKEGKEAWVEPLIEGDKYRFTVQTAGKGKTPPKEAKNGTKLARGAYFRCVLSGTTIVPDYIKTEGKAGRMGTRLLAVVAEGTRNRSYVTPTERMEAVARNAKPEWKPDVELPNDPRAIWTPSYGLTHFYHLFTHRQLVALTAFSDLVSEARIKVVEDANAALRHRGGQSLHEGGRGAVAYADSIAVGLSFAISKLADRGSTICTWFTERDSTRNTFARQGIPMTWDYAELNPLLDGTGSFRGAVEWTAESISALGNVSCESSVAYQRDAQWQQISIDKIISTDPPYFDNIPYADLSDFFYVWLRRSLKNVFPELFATVATPKEEELVASPYHQAGKEAAKRFFLDGMTKALSNLASQAHPAFPTSIYYALKQSDTGDKGTASTGWEVFLTAVMKAGLTWISTTPNRLSSGRV